MSLWGSLHEKYKWQSLGNIWVDMYPHNSGRAHTNSIATVQNLGSFQTSLLLHNFIWLIIVSFITFFLISQYLGTGKTVRPDRALVIHGPDVGSTLGISCGSPAHQKWALSTEPGKNHFVWLPNKNQNKINKINKPVLVSETSESLNAVTYSSRLLNWGSGWGEPWFTNY